MNFVLPAIDAYSRGENVTDMLGTMLLSHAHQWLVA